MTPGDRASQRAEPEPAPASRASAGAAPPVDVTAVRDAFSLDWDVAHLNHGSFGAVPRSVQDAVARTRAAAERDYDAFFADRLFDELAASRTALAAWLGWSPEGTVFAANATTALQTAVAHLALQPGDEVVTTSHEYDATNRVLELLAGRGVTIQIVPVSALDAPTIVARVLDAVGTRTRAVLLSHVTSPWAEVLPVELAAAALAGTRPPCSSTAPTVPVSSTRARSPGTGRGTPRRCTSGATSPEGPVRSMCRPTPATPSGPSSRAGTSVLAPRPNGSHGWAPPTSRPCS